MRKLISGREVQRQTWTAGELNQKVNHIFFLSIYYSFSLFSLKVSEARETISMLTIDKQAIVVSLKRS